MATKTLQTLRRRAFSARAAARRAPPPPASDAEDYFPSGGAHAMTPPTEGISRPLSTVLKELGKKVPDSFIRTRVEPDGFSVKYIPWHIANRILNIHAQEWSDLSRSHWNSFHRKYGLWRPGADGRSYGFSPSLCSSRSWPTSLSRRYGIECSSSVCYAVLHGSSEQGLLSHI